jgi:soluble P-type ATPase
MGGISGSLPEELVARARGAMMAEKRSLHIQIPGFGERKIHTIISDFSGTLSRGGKVVPEVREKLIQLAEWVDIHVLSADTFGTATQQLEGVPVILRILEQGREHEQKAVYASRHRPENVCALGNGNNDRLLLVRVKEAGGLSIAVDNGEGCAVETLLQGHVMIHGAANALDLLLEPLRFLATLRF